jgi:phosphatidylethanolamine/phosphatidyl-N-methylethanolamine N-methyltransferase
VVKPGGEIIINTRVGAEKGMRKTIEKTLMPITSKLGWRTEFSFGRYEAWAAETPSVKLVERRSLPPLGHFAMVRFQKLGQPQHAAA